MIGSPSGCYLLNRLLGLPVLLVGIKANRGEQHRPLDKILIKILEAGKLHPIV